jgi:hypothetical protein
MGETYLMAARGVFISADGRVVNVDKSFYFITVTDAANEKPSDNGGSSGSGGGGGDIGGGGDSDTGGDGGSDDSQTQGPPVPAITGALLLKGDGADLASATYESDYAKNIIEGQCALQIVFNDEMDFTAADSYIAINPNRVFVCETIDAKTLKISFDGALQKEKKFSITLLAGLESSQGVLMTEDSIFEFTEWKPELDIIGVQISQCSGNSWGSVDYDNFSGPHLTGAKEYMSTGVYELSFIFEFNKTLKALHENVECPAIMLEAIDEDMQTDYPPSIAYDFINEDDDPPDEDCFCYSQDWEDIQFGENGNPDIPPVEYRITIPGGIDGIHNGAGFYIPNDKIIYLQVIENK